MIENTLSEFGGVSRGVCETEKNTLLSIKETHELQEKDNVVIGKYENETVYPVSYTHLTLPTNREV